MAATTTAIGNFGSTVTDLIRAEVIANLRDGLPHLPREVTVFGTYVKGTDGTFRYVKFADLPANTTPLVEGVTPTGQLLDVDFDQFDVDQHGDVVRSSDEFAMKSPGDVIATMVERTKRAAAESMDALAQAIWDSTPAGETVLGEAGNVADDQPDVWGDAYAILSARGVGRVGGAKSEESGQVGGSYIAIAHSFVIADLKKSAFWVETAKYAQPTALLTNEVGMFRGIRFIESPRATVDGTTYRTFVAGSQALAWADPSLLQTTYVGFVPSDSDPLAQRASAGWKGWAGGTLVGTGAESDGKPRYVVVESSASLHGTV